MARIFEVRRGTMQRWCAARPRSEAVHGAAFFDETKCRTNDMTAAASEHVPLAY